MHLFFIKSKHIVMVKHNSSFNRKIHILSSLTSYFSLKKKDSKPNIFNYIQITWGKLLYLDIGFLARTNCDPQVV